MEALKRDQGSELGKDVQHDGAAAAAGTRAAAPGSPTAPPATAAALPASAAVTAGAASVPAAGPGSTLATLHAAHLAEPHYDTSKEMVLQFEYLSNAAVKAIIISVWVVVGVALFLLCGMVALQAAKDQWFWFRKDLAPLVNLCFSSICTLALVPAWLRFVVRVTRSSHSGKRWTHRRKRLAAMAFTELTAQLACIIAFLIPNAYLVAGSCVWFDSVIAWCAFIRWTCWNCTFCLYWIEAHSNNPARPNSRWAGYPNTSTGGAPGVIDAPLWLHWPKAAFWAVNEGFVLTLLVLVRNEQAEAAELAKDPSIDCRQYSYECIHSPAIVVLLCLYFGGMISYFLLYALFIRRAFRNLLRLPYNLHRAANLVTRMQIRLRAISIAFFAAAGCSYTFIGINTCRSYLFTWGGFLPMQLVLTLSALANTFLMTPTRPNDAGILQAWLQEFAWTEASLPKRRAERVSSLTPGPGSPPVALRGATDVAAKLDKEPMFCFETALKALYWSFLVYDYQEISDTPYSMSSALRLYSLHQDEMIWEKSTDIKVLVGWSDDMVVVAFRGTASLTNIKSDAQVWRTQWPPSAGNAWLGRVPMIHWGFHRVWTSNGFREQLMAFLRQRMRPPAPAGLPAGKPVRVLITGHSLGGALATLCAFDAARELPAGAATLECYTFGAPRTGNHAFARLYNKAVPDTWHIINSDDVVTQAGKFFVLYKRCGQRVLVDRLGDMIVRPSYAETVNRRVPGDLSFHDHLLTSYQVALASVLGAQFSTKSFENGRAGVLSLAGQRAASVLLRTAGLAHESLDFLERHGWEAFLAAQAARKKMERRSRHRRAWSWPLHSKQKRAQQQQQAAGAAAVRGGGQAGQYAEEAARARAGSRTAEKAATEEGEEQDAEPPTAGEALQQQPHLPERLGLALRRAATSLGRYGRERGPVLEQSMSMRGPVTMDFEELVLDFPLPDDLDVEAEMAVLEAHTGTGCRRDAWDKV